MIVEYGVEYDWDVPITERQRKYHAEHGNTTTGNVTDYVKDFGVAPSWLNGEPSDHTELYGFSTPHEWLAQRVSSLVDCRIVGKITGILMDCEDFDHHTAMVEVAYLQAFVLEALEQLWHLWSNTGGQDDSLSERLLG